MSTRIGPIPSDNDLGRDRNSIRRHKISNEILIVSGKDEMNVESRGYLERPSTIVSLPNTFSNAKTIDSNLITSTEKNVSIVNEPPNSETTISVTSEELEQSSTDTRQLLTQKMNISTNKTLTEGPNDKEDLKIFRNSSPLPKKGIPNMNIIRYLIWKDIT